MPVLQEVRHALRMLSKNRSFTAVATVTLALGIGANTTMFSLLDSVWLRPLPFPDPEHLVIAAVQSFEPGSQHAIGQTQDVSPSDFLAWKEHGRSFLYVAGCQRTSVVLNQEIPERIPALEVTPSFFPLLGVVPLAGRLFSSKEDGQDKTIVVSEGFWRHRFASDPTVIGKEYTINRERYAVVGVAPGSLGAVWSESEIYLPLNVDSDQTSDGDPIRHLRVVGRLKQGVSVAQAETELTAIARRVTEEDATPGSTRKVVVQPLHEWKLGDVASRLWLFFGAVTFVLGIACASVATMLLARSAERQREMAVRTVLGSERWRLIRQLLVETICLALLGGMVGLMLGYWGIELVKIFVADSLPRVREIQMDTRALLFTLSASVVTGILFGLAPALRLSNLDLNKDLKEGTRTASAGLGQHRTRNVLVICEMAFVVVLLVGAGLMLRSLAFFSTVSPGFETDRLLRILPPFGISNESGSAPFFQQVADHVQSTPGVESVAIGGLDSYPTKAEVPTSNTGTDNLDWEVGYIPVGRGYFSTVRITLVRGRYFNAKDGPSAENVAIISEALARRFWTDSDPIGKRIRLSEGPETGIVERQIVGVAGDIRYPVFRDPQPRVYLPYTQTTLGATIPLVLRTTEAAPNLFRSVKQRVAQIAPGQPVEIERIADFNWRTLTHIRFPAFLFGAFGLLALSIAAFGLYGVISYSIAQRTHEIGIRMALGANRRKVLRMVLGEGMLLVLAALAIGISGALILSRMLLRVVYGISPPDAATFAFVSAVLVGVTFFACYLPARRTLKSDPMKALRYE